MQTEERKLPRRLTFTDDAVPGFVATERHRPFLHRKRRGHPITPNPILGGTDSRRFSHIDHARLDVRVARGTRQIS